MLERIRAAIEEVENAGSLLSVANVKAIQGHVGYYRQDHHSTMDGNSKNARKNHSPTQRATKCMPNFVFSMPCNPSNAPSKFTNRNLAMSKRSRTSLYVIALHQLQFATIPNHSHEA